MTDVEPALSAGVPLLIAAAAVAVLLGTIGSVLALILNVLL